MKYTNLKYVYFYLTCLGLTLSQEYKKPTEYHAVGEIIYPSLNEVITQVYFEEFYSENRAEFVLIGALSNMTFMQDVRQQKMWKIEAGECVQFSARDWEAEHIPPQLRAFETKDGNPLLPINQLFELREKNPSVKSTKSIKYRNIDGENFFYTLPGDEGNRTEVQAYWSDGSMTSTSKGKAPIGFQITSFVKNVAVRHQYINIHMYFEGKESFKKVEPTRGIYCPNVTKSNMMRDQINKLTSLSYSSELVVMEQLIKNIDVWLNPNKFARHDYSIHDSPEKDPVRISRITSVKQGDGTVYEISHRHFEKPQCEVKTVKSIKFDSQIIVPEEKATSFDAFFGFDSTEYHTIGTIEEHGLRCRLFHGLRTDWPPNEKDITTLWEWCIVDTKSVDKAPKFDEEHFPLVSLNIYVTKSPYNSSTGFYYQGDQFSHTFYNIHNYPAKQVDTNFFDISECFENDKQSTAQILVELQEKEFDDLQQDRESIMHIIAWRDALFSAAGLSDTSLRISKPLLGFYSFNSSHTMTVRFTVMDRHPSISAEVEPVDLSQGIANIRKVLNNNELKVTYKEHALQGKPGSLSILKKLTISDEDGDEGGSGYSAGTMAGVAIAMLLIGAAIGVGGLFFKKKYYDRR